MLAELAILQTIIICVKTTCTYQVQDNWNLNTTIANHLDQSLWLPDQKQGRTVRSHLLHSSLAYAQLCCTFYQPQWTIKICRSKTIFLSQTKHCNMAPLLWPGNQTQIILLSWPFWRAMLFSSPNSPASTAVGGPTLNKIMIVLSISHSLVIWANNYHLLLTLKYQLYTISSAGLVWRQAKQSSKSTNRNTFQLTYIASLTESITTNKPSLLKSW